MFAASAIQQPMWAMRSLADHSGVTPTWKRRSLGAPSTSARSSAQRASSWRISSVRRSAIIAIPSRPAPASWLPRKELEGPVPAHDLLAPPRAHGCELPLDALLRQTPLERRHLPGILEVRGGHPPLHGPADDPIPLSLAPDHEPLAGRAEHDVRLPSRLRRWLVAPRVEDL